MHDVLRVQILHRAQQLQYNTTQYDTPSHKCVARKDNRHQQHTRHMCILINTCKHRCKHTCLLHDYPRALLAVSAAQDDAVEQVAARHQLHHDEQHAAYGLEGVLIERE